jgi:hypothetical protein
MKLDITKLKEGDRFWVGDREYEFDEPAHDLNGPDDGIFYREPYYIAKDITCQEGTNATPTSLKEDTAQYDFKKSDRCAFPLSQEVFSTKEEAVDAHIKQLETLIKIHTANYLRIKKTLDNLMDEKGRFEKLR